MDNLRNYLEWAHNSTPWTDVGPRCWNFGPNSEGAIQLDKALPVVIHGDEGTTYKKDGCLVFSFHSVVGCGTISNKLGPVANDDRVDPHTNFVGNAFQTRFLLGSLLRDSWTI